MNVVLRKAKQEDREKVRWVESKSTPTLIYTPYVYDEFLSDGGEFSVEELDGELVACGKYTPLPDGSAWIETLRVIPEKQGLGLGKKLYDHWTKLAKEQGIKAMRMYTGVSNVVSAGLAERYGLKLQGTFKGNTTPAKPGDGQPGGFKQVTDPKKAAKLVMPLKDDVGELARPQPDLLQVQPRDNRLDGGEGYGLRGREGEERRRRRRPLHATSSGTHRMLGRRRRRLHRIRQVEGGGEWCPDGQLLLRGHEARDRESAREERIRRSTKATI